MEWQLKVLFFPYAASRQQEGKGRKKKKGREKKTSREEREKKTETEKQLGK